MLHDALGALLAIDVVQELYETLTGKRYPLPSLPSRGDLQRLRKQYEPHLREGKSWQWIDAVAERLREAL